MNLHLILTPQIKINTKWIIGLYVKPKTIKLIEKIGKNLHDLGFSKEFLDMTSIAQCIQEIICKLDIFKIKNSCSVNNTVKRMKRQPTHLEKIFTNHISDKVLVHRIYKEFSKLKKVKGLRSTDWYLQNSYGDIMYSIGI